MGQGPLQHGTRAPTSAVPGKRVQREEAPLQPGGLALKRMKGLPTGLGGQGRPQTRRGGRVAAEIEVGAEPIALEGAVVAIIQG